MNRSCRHNTERRSRAQSGPTLTWKPLGSKNWAIWAGRATHLHHQYMPGLEAPLSYRVPSAGNPRETHRHKSKGADAWAPEQLESIWKVVAFGFRLQERQFTSQFGHWKLLEKTAPFPTSPRGQHPETLRPELGSPGLRTKDNRSTAGTPRPPSRPTRDPAASPSAARGERGAPGL